MARDTYSFDDHCTEDQENDALKANAEMKNTSRDDAKTDARCLLSNMTSSSALQHQVKTVLCEGGILEQNKSYQVTESSHEKVASNEQGTCTSKVEAKPSSASNLQLGDSEVLLKVPPTNEHQVETIHKLQKIKNEESETEKVSANDLGDDLADGLPTEETTKEFQEVENLPSLQDSHFENLDLVSQNPRAEASEDCDPSEDVFTSSNLRGLDSYIIRINFNDEGMAEAETEIVAGTVQNPDLTKIDDLLRDPSAEEQAFQDALSEHSSLEDVSSSTGHSTYFASSEHSRSMHESTCHSRYDSSHSRFDSSMHSRLNSSHFRRDRKNEDFLDFAFEKIEQMACTMDDEPETIKDILDDVFEYLEDVACGEIAKERNAAMKHSFEKFLKGVDHVARLVPTEDEKTGKRKKKDLLDVVCRHFEKHSCNKSGVGSIFAGIFDKDLLDDIFEHIDSGRGCKSKSDNKTQSIGRSCGEHSSDKKSNSLLAKSCEGRISAKDQFLYKIEEESFDQEPPNKRITKETKSSAKRSHFAKLRGNVHGMISKKDVMNKATEYRNGMNTAMKSAGTQLSTLVDGTEIDKVCDLVVLGAAKESEVDTKRERPLNSSEWQYQRESETLVVYRSSFEKASQVDSKEKLADEECCQLSKQNAVAADETRPSSSGLEEELQLLSQKTLANKSNGKSSIPGRATPDSAITETTCDETVDHLEVDLPVSVQRLKNYGEKSLLEQLSDIGSSNSFEPEVDADIVAEIEAELEAKESQDTERFLLLQEQLNTVEQIADNIISKRDRFGLVQPLGDSQATHSVDGSMMSFFSTAESFDSESENEAIPSILSSKSHVAVEELALNEVEATIMEDPSPKPMSNSKLVEITDVVFRGDIDATMLLSCNMLDYLRNLCTEMTDVEWQDQRLGLVMKILMLVAYTRMNVASSANDSMKSPFEEEKSRHTTRKMLSENQNSVVV